MGGMRSERKLKQSGDQCNINKPYCCDDDL